MARANSYKPRFVDIRIKPPNTDRAAPEERVCDWPGCTAPGACKAPMGPAKLREFYYFCPAHAAQYNKNWDFFADMSEGEAAAYHDSAATGHRPTWRMGRAPNQARTASRAGFVRGWGRLAEDQYGLFGDPAEGGRDARPTARRIGKLEARALETMGLDAEADGPVVRARYAELVKRLHPDANGGDRSTEEQLGKVIRAFQTLKKAGYV